MTHNRWTRSNRTHWLIIMGGCIAAMACTGCGVKEINSNYGKRRSPNSTSVNGTSILGDMFASRGHKVKTWTRLSPRLEQSNTIVWVPNSFELPTAKEIEYLETWLAEGYERTLIYVARDYDAASEYYETLANSLEGEAYLEARSRMARAQSDHALARSYTGVEMECSWFSIDSHVHFVQVTPNKGKWASKISQEQTDIHVSSELKLAKADDIGHTILLGSNETPLIAKITNKPDWGDSKIIVVLNGSMVLNLPQVNHETRKIAAELIAECGQPDVTTFLESGASGLQISERDPQAYTDFAAFTVWPVSSILLHLTFFGILYCIMVFPIFGKPRSIPNDTPSDFGKHIRAQGELLERVGNRMTAMWRIQQYRKLMHDPKSRDTTSAGNPFQNREESTATSPFQAPTAEPTEIPAQKSTEETSA